jgi:hypothetical protein
VFVSLSLGFVKGPVCSIFFVFLVGGIEPLQPCPMPLLLLPQNRSNSFRLLGVK